MPEPWYPKPYYPIRGMMSIEDAVQTAVQCREGRRTLLDIPVARRNASEAADVLNAQAAAIMSREWYNVSTVQYLSNLADIAANYATAIEENSHCK